MATTTAPDLTGWETHLVELSDGLDLALDHHQYRLARRLSNRARHLVADDAERAALLRALARWLGRPTRATVHATLYDIVATGWAAETARRADTAASRAAGDDPFARIAAPDDEPW